MAAIKYKGTDNQWHLLNNVLVKGIEVIQTSGDSETYVMSQKAVTETISGVNESLTSHTNNNEIHLTQVEKADIDAIDGNIGVLSGITAEDVANWDSAYTETHIHSNKAYIDTVSGNVGTMAYENASSYSSATEVNTALGGKSDTGHTHSLSGITDVTAPLSGVNSITGAVGTMAYENASSYSSATEVGTALSGKSDTGHTHVAADVTDLGTMAKENKTSYSSATEINTALSGKSDTSHTHSSADVTAMTNYTSAVTSSAISTSDSLNTAIGKLEKALDGIKLRQITQAGYDALVAGGNVDASTLYIITDN